MHCNQASSIHPYDPYREIDPFWSESAGNQEPSFLGRVARRIDSLMQLLFLRSSPELPTYSTGNTHSTYSNSLTFQTPPGNRTIGWVPLVRLHPNENENVLPLIFPNRAPSGDLVFHGNTSSLEAARQGSIF